MTVNTVNAYFMSSCSQKMDSRSEFFMKLWFPKELRSCLDKALKSKPQTSFLNLPTVTVSFRSYLHRCFAGKVFKLRHVNNNSPVAWATSRSRSNESPRELGEDTLKPPLRPPSEVEVIILITEIHTSFCSTQTRWQHNLRRPTGLGSSRVTTGAGTQLFEQVDH